MNEKESKTHQVAVYGTLREGFGNHYLLRDAKRLGDFKTEPDVYKMLSFGGFPALTVAGDESVPPVVCEVYEVDDATLANLDRLEGHPGWYQRHEIDSPFGSVWIYVMPRTSTSRSYPAVESGDWAEYRNLRKESASA